MKCFTEKVASAGCDNKLTCPCCKEKKKEFTYHQRSFSQPEGTDGVSLRNIATKHTITAPDKERDPVRYYHDNVDGDMCEEFCSFTMVTAKSVRRRKKKKTKKQAVLKVHTGIFNTKDPDGWSEHNIDVIESIF